jgi:hypothetical protein
VVKSPLAGGAVVLRGGVRIGAAILEVVPGRSWTWRVKDLRIRHEVHLIFLPRRNVLAFVGLPGHEEKRRAVRRSAAVPLVPTEPDRRDETADPMGLLVSP